MSGEEHGRNVNTQLQAAGRRTPLGSFHTKVYQGGTTWSIAAVAAAILCSLRLWTLVPIALERFAFGSCQPSAASAQLTWLQVVLVLLGGLVAVVLAEYGARREGNRWLSMVGSVVGVSCVFGGGLLAFVLLVPPLSCTP